MSNDIIDIKKIDITNPAEVLRAAGVIIDYDLFVEAYLLYAKLRETSPNPSFVRRGNAPSPLEGEGWGEVLNKLKWIALPKFSEDEIVKMFGESFTTIFELPDYNLWGKIKQKIIADIWYEDRDNFKKAIGKALLKNTEWLTSQNIIINGKEEHPTVGNWLKDYNVNLGFAPVNAAKQSEYLTNSGNMKKLVSSIKYKVSSEGEEKSEIRNWKLEGKEKVPGTLGVPGTDENMSEKDRLKILFNFYEKLKLSSLTAEGLEEDIFIDEDGVRGVLSEGTFTKIDPKVEQRLRELQKIIDRATSIKQENNKTTKQEEQKLEIGNWKLGEGEGDRIKNQELRIKNGGEGGEGRNKISNFKFQILKKGQISNNKFQNGEGQEGEQKLEIGPSNTAGRNWKLGKGEGGEGEKGVEQRAKRAYIFSLDEQTLIKDHENDIKRIARGNIILVGKELTRAMEEKNRTRVIAALRIAVKNNLLIGWSLKNQTDKHGLKTDEDGSRIKEGSDPLGGGQTPSAALISFLRKVLQDKLGLNESEAAKIGVHIYNLFRKLGRDVGYLAYYDERTGRFCWMTGDGGNE
ncbi:MAG: hypothetical protein V1770_00340 [bacterium]